MRTGLHKIETAGAPADIALAFLLSLLLALAALAAWQWGEARRCDSLRQSDSPLAVTYCTHPTTDQETSP